MISRASRDLAIETVGETCKEQTNLSCSQFQGTHDIGRETEYIFDRASGIRICLGDSCRNKCKGQEKARLVAFDIVEFGSKDYAFYMFNFTSREDYVPGASDLLLNEMIRLAREKGKRFINLGLGINKGISFFKNKMGRLSFPGLPVLSVRDQPQSSN